MNHSRRNRFDSKDGPQLTQVDNELQMLADNHNTHDAGLKGWRNVNIVDGTNKRMGVSTLVGGTVTVSNTSVTASTRIFTARQTAGGTLGHLSIGTVVPATSFIINSSSATDTSIIAWLLIEPKA